MKSDKMSYIIHADLESFKKIDEYTINSEKSSTTETGENFPCRCSILTIWAFETIENKYSLHRGEDCMKHFCSSLREHATDVIKFEKQTKTQNYINMQQHVTFAEKYSWKNLIKIKLSKS